jgi:hypothetical protein
VQQKKNAQLLWNEAWNEYTKMSTYQRLELAAGLRRSILIRKMPHSGKSKDQSGYNRMSNGESSTRTGRFGRRLKALLRLR